MTKYKLVALFAFIYFNVHAQFAGPDTTEMFIDSTSIQKRTVIPPWIVTAIHSVAVTGSLYALSEKWYAKYPSGSFRTVNDMNNWLCMDKCGHAWSAYNLARSSSLLWEVGGADHKHAVYRAGIFALSYQSAIELMDGFSSKWGFSWGDMGANIIGVMAYTVQELAQKKQVVQLKFMTTGRIHYAPDLLARANDLFGHSFANRLLSDYNAQTYWASFNLKKLFPSASFKPWLNLAIGYGAGNMLGETNNCWTAKNGVIIDRPDISRYSRWFISPDIDFTMIRTSHKWIQTLLFIINAFKLPAPAIEWRKGKIKFHALLVNG